LLKRGGGCPGSSSESPGNTKNYGLPLLDLTNEGNLGLMKAVGRFDPDKGAKLSTFRAWWIKQAIRRALDHESDSPEPDSAADEDAGLPSEQPLKQTETRRVLGLIGQLPLCEASIIRLRLVWTAARSARSKICAASSG